MKRNQIFTLLFILAAFIIGLGLFLLFYFPESTIIIFVLVIGMIFFIVLIIILAVLKVKREPPPQEKVTAIPQATQVAFDAYDQRLQQALKIAEKKKDDLSVLKLNSINEYLGKLDMKDVCMVCKLQLVKKDDILQCPRCESLFHKNHLLDWISINEKCPVCSKIIKKKHEEK